MEERVSGRLAYHDNGDDDNNNNDISKEAALKRQHAAKPPAIQLLPPTVIAQLKSSASITTLTGVILGLLQNALDASATKLTIAVDFARGNCTVEDNGLGIPSSEFDEAGGLCKLHHTSKFTHSSNPTTMYGTTGTFLASLAALCLLTITSKHQGHPSTNSLLVHQNQLIARLTPAPASHSLESRDHGTRVVVRDLFGNLPVRVRQRAMLAEDQREIDTLWDELKGAIVALLISFGAKVNLRVRDTAVSSRRELVFKDVEAGSERTNGSLLSSKHRQILFLLRQIRSIPTGVSGTWIPSSASSNDISVQGIICLDPAPTKSVQFLSLGIMPLMKADHNVLFEQINRLFSRSRFGVVDDTMDMTKGLTRKQIVGEKGIDRWPMFVLKIEVGDRRNKSEDDVLWSEASMTKVVRVLEALVVGWLEAHHFKAKTDRPLDPLISPNETSYADSVALPSRERTSESRLSTPQKNNESGAKGRARPYTGVPTVNALSRIKSSHKAQSLGKRLASAPSNETHLAKKILLDAASISHDRSRRSVTRTDPRSTLYKDSTIGQQDTFIPDLSLHEGTADGEDEAVDWVDPTTESKHRLNARTGMPMPSSRPSTRVGSLSMEATRTRNRGSLPSGDSRAPIENKRGNTERFLDCLLTGWDNPVFRLPEQPIPRASFDMSIAKDITMLQSTKEMEKTFGGVLRLRASKISKRALKDAEIISQVDEKFILVRLDKCEDCGTSDGGEDEGGGESRRSLLVAIDQHAADERVKVERLLHELCSPINDASDVPMLSSQQGLRSAVKTTTLEQPVRFEVPVQEGDLLRRYAAHFADWGILFDIQPSSHSSEQTDEQHIVVVRALPPAIASRCSLTPKLLITLLRSSAWTLSDDSSAVNARHAPISTSTTEAEHPPSWIKRIGSCPHELLSMVNLRACRSAVMFNDALTLEQCEDIVEKLAGCVFPFMCAHGRPSMVPLVDLDMLDGRLANHVEEEQVDYATAFAHWKRDRSHGG